MVLKKQPARTKREQQKVDRLDAEWAKRYNALSDLALRIADSLVDQSTVKVGALRRYRQVRNRTWEVLEELKELGAF